MVVGGYEHFNPGIDCIYPDYADYYEGDQLELPTCGNGLTNNIELITPTNGKYCSIQVKPLYGRKVELDGGVKVNEFDASGMTGQFVNEAPIGKIVTHQNYKCIHYNFEI